MSIQFGTITLANGATRIARATHGEVAYLTSGSATSGAWRGRVATPKQAATFLADSWVRDVEQAHTDALSPVGRVAAEQAIADSLSVYQAHAAEALALNGPAMPDLLTIAEHWHAMSQGLAPAMSALDRAGVAYELAQTGGWVMVLEITVPNHGVWGVTEGDVDGEYLVGWRDYAAYEAATEETHLHVVTAAQLVSTVAVAPADAPTAISAPRVPDLVAVYTRPGDGPWVLSFADDLTDDETDPVHWAAELVREAREADDGTRVTFSGSWVTPATLQAIRQLTS